MTGPGYGTVWSHTDHDLVGRVLAEKHRLSRIPLSDKDTVRVVRRGVAS